MKNQHDDAYCTINSGEACGKLGISRDTLYAYVSRGFVRAIAHPGDARKSLYDRRDVETLLHRKKRGRSRQAVAESTINWGEPVLASKVTRIADGMFYYRGKNAVELSENWSLEEVLELISGVRQKVPTLAHSDSASSNHPLPFNRILCMMAGRAASNSKGDGRSAARMLLRLTALSASGKPDIPNLPIHELLSRAWAKGIRSNGTDPSDIIRRALVLCADHELNASTYATRVAASAGASLSASLLAGLATLSGSKHGGSTTRCRTWMDEIEGNSPAQDRSTLSLAGKPPPGFGHPLYPDGDPRAKALLCACQVPASWKEIIEGVFIETGVHPTLDFALAFLERDLRLPKGAGLGIFAVGRTAGWIAHIFEQRESGQLIRPRATVGGE